MINRGAIYPGYWFLKRNDQHAHMHTSMHTRTHVHTYLAIFSVISMFVFSFEVGSPSPPSDLDPPLYERKPDFVRL